MRIFVAGLETETNTFSPFPTKMDDYHITRVEDLDDQMEPLASMPPFLQWIERAKAIGSDLVFSVYGWAQPAGPTERSAYESFRDKILSDLEGAGEIDIVLLFLHGAMIAEGCEDCEADLMSRIRQKAGPQVVIAAELDLHAQLSSAMLDVADILVAYKEYPHIDVAARGEELFELAVKTWKGEIHPAMAMVDCNMLGLFPTTASPLREFVDAMTDAESRPGILSLSFIHGFTYGDVSFAGSKVLAITDGDNQLAADVASEFADRVYTFRHSIAVQPLTLDEALQEACAFISDSDRNSGCPVVVADQSDNAGCGAPADSTFALHWLLENGIENAAIAIFYDPNVVKQAIQAGEGSKVLCNLGGHHGAVSGQTLTAEFEVIKIVKDYHHQFPQVNSEPQLMPLGNTVSLRFEGVELVVSSRRCQCFCPSIFDDLGIKALEKDLLIPKSGQHFYNAFYPIASQIIYMAASGAVPPDITRVPFKKMPMLNKFPWVDDPRSTHGTTVYVKECRR